MGITKEQLVDAITQTKNYVDIKSGQSVQANFLSEEGFGNLRYYNGHLQMYNVDTESWIDTSITPDNVTFLNLVPEPVTNLRGFYDVEAGHFKLRFAGPTDNIVNNVLTCYIDKVIIRRKQDSEPIDENDGELAAELGRDTMYNYNKEAWYCDESFTPNNDEVWYYKAFSVSTFGIYNSYSNAISIKAKDHYLFGFKLDQTESDPASMITYIEDNKDFIHCGMDFGNDKFDYADWDEAWFMKVVPCMLNYNGTVAYELDPNDYTKKKDGTASDVANTSFGGNAMVGIPKSYYKLVDNGDDTINIYISNKKVDTDFYCWSHIDNNGKEIDYCYVPCYLGFYDGSRIRSLSGFRSSTNAQTYDIKQLLAKAKANNAGSEIWHIELFNDRQLINLLLLLIGKSTDTQAVFGRGYSVNDQNIPAVNSNNNATSGDLNKRGLFYGSNRGVKVFGMEHYWGASFRWVFGFSIQKNTARDAYIKMTYGTQDGSPKAGYSTEDYTSCWLKLSGYYSSIKNGYYYMSKMKATKFGLLPYLQGGSATTYYPDAFEYQPNGSNFTVVGGDYTCGAYCGALFTGQYNYSQSGYSISASLSCKPLSTN